MPEDRLETGVAKARVALGRPGVIVGAGAASRYELFHAARSICSQKVRAVLAHHDIPYVSHVMDLFAGDTYLPDYVRLRMRGCDRLGGPLADHHSGSTATEGGGCDGAVVPTLVDWRTGEVLVDSKRICLTLDAEQPDGRRLRPDALAAAVNEQLAIVDDLPNYQLLMERAPADAGSADDRQELLAAFSRRKVAWCDQHLREHPGDQVLSRAYTAKRAKEGSAADALFSPEAMSDAYAKADSALHDLEQLLAPGNGRWLLSDRFTLADLFWAIELVRMEDVGIASFWGGDRLPRVRRFASVIPAVDAIRQAVLEWPGARF